MTCIVGFKTRDKVYIGGDTLGSGGQSGTVRKDGKVFRNKDMIFGFTSSYRMGQLLRYVFTPPAHPEGEDDMTYLVKRFVPEVIDCFSKGQFLTKSSDAISGGTFLFGYRGELYKIYSDMQVAISTLPYEACGCGEEYAKGAMGVLVNSIHLDPEEIITKALEITTVHSTGVGGSFEIISI